MQFTCDILPAKVRKVKTELLFSRKAWYAKQPAELKTECGITLNADRNFLVAMRPTEHACNSCITAGITTAMRMARAGACGNFCRNLPGDDHG